MVSLCLAKAKEMRDLVSHESSYDEYYDDGYYSGQPYFNRYYGHKPLGGSGLYFKGGKGGVYKSGSGYAHGQHTGGYGLKKFGKKGFAAHGLGGAAGYKHNKLTHGSGGK